MTNFELGMFIFLVSLFVLVDMCGNYLLQIRDELRDIRKIFESRP